MPSFLALARSITAPTPRGRMMRGVLANLYDKGAVTAVQLLTIPLLTRLWGADGYGIWLMLLTVPTYIALSDLGFGTAAGVVVTRSAATQDYDTSIEAVQSTIAFVLGTVSVVAFAALGYAGWLALAGQAGGPFTPGQIATAVVLITAYAVVCTQMSIVTVIYRGTHKFAQAMFFAGTLILLEGAALAAIALTGGSIARAAAAYLVIRVLGYLLFVRLLKAREPWVEIGVRRATRATIRSLAKPSAAALGLTFATALLLQGMVLALGATAGAATVAVFGASRTLSRAPLQLSGMFLRPSLPELTRAITEGNRPLERRLTRMNTGVAVAVTLPFGLVLWFFGQPLLGRVSEGELHAPATLFALLALATIANATWMALAAPLIALNRQAEFSYLYLVLCAIAVILVALHPGAIFAAALMVAVEMAVLAKLVFATNRTKG